MTLSDAIQRYVTSLETHAYSPATRQMAHDWLARFQAFCATVQVTELAAVTDQQVTDYQRHLMWVGPPGGGLYSRNTVDIALRMVRNFFLWTTRERYVLVNPCRNLVLRRVPSLPRPPLSVAQVERMLDIPDVTTPCGLRDKTVLETLYATGMRRAECHGLDLDDLHLDDGIVLVRDGKGQRQRWLPLGESLTETLQAYLSQSRPLLCTDTGQTALFVSKASTRFSQPCMNQLVVKVSQIAGLPAMGCHGLRHAFANHLMENGADLVALQAFLGHRFLHTTQIYTQALQVELHKEYQATHPRARKRPR